MPRRWWRRLTEWWQADRVEADMAAELESHLDHLTDEYVRRGLAPDAARQAAQREIGGLAQAQSLARDARGFRILDALAHDTKLGLRQLRKTPAFTIAALATLAIGTGATTAIYAIVDAVLLRPVPYMDSDRVVALWEEISAAPGVIAESGGPSRFAVAPANLRDYQARVSAFDAVAAYSSTARNLTGNGRAERILTEDVDPDYFRVFSVPAVLGRLLTDEDVTAGRQVAVISHALWQRRFGGDPQVTSHSLVLNQVAYQIVGVLPPDFISPTNIDQSDSVGAWLPMVLEDVILRNRGEHIVSVAALLKPGVTLTSARSELAAAADAMAQDFPDYVSTRPAIDLMRKDKVTAVNTMLYVLLAAVGLVVLLASVNVAGLLIVRALGRQRDIAVRYALGASRARALFEQGIQSLLLAVLGGSAGLLLGYGLLRGLLSVAPSTIPLLGTTSLDLRVGVVSALVALATALAFGLWPALHAARVDPAETLKAHDRPTAGSSLLARRSPVLIIEIAVATVVLVGAVLMIRSLARLQDVDLGFDPRNVIGATVSLPSTKYATPESRLQFFTRLETELRALPGVTDVAFGNRLPLLGNWTSGIIIDDPANPDGPPVDANAGFQAVSPAYFTTFGINLRRGRLLNGTDRLGTEAVAVVNEAYARTLLGGADPLGRTLKRGPAAPVITIVGVVSDIRRTGRTDDTGRSTAAVVPQVYLAAAQSHLYPLALRDIGVRTEAAALASVAAAIPRLVTTIDPDQPVGAVRTLEDALALRSAQQRFQTWLFLLFGAAAVLLALVGTYGVVSYGVTQRRSEIALRMALGASRTTVVRDFVTRTTVLLAAGAVCGLGLAALGAGLMANLLFELPAREPATYVVVALAVVIAGGLASTVAAVRATAIDPIQALR
ncbi:MAG: hypothetical protein AMXMBFR57_25440 [Acidimicrobiia bacterium]